MKHGTLDLIAKSKYFDLFGVFLVFLSAHLAGYLYDNLAATKFFRNSAWAVYVPFGPISALSSSLSLLSTRLTGRLSNWGNWLGLFNVVMAGYIDFLHGNKAAPLSYPITFIIYIYAIEKWMQTEKYRTSQPLAGRQALWAFGLVAAICLSFSYYINDLGFAAHNRGAIFWFTTVVFALSLAGNILNAMKLTVQWKFWFLYNLAQLAKSLVQGNFANVGKYIYYLINAIACLDFWRKFDRPREAVNGEAVNG